MTLSFLFLLFCSSVVRAEDVEENFEEALAAPVEIDPGLFSEDEQNRMKQSEESFQFEAEVDRLMNIIIYSLYNNREVFIRELVSNSADALDKVRHLALKKGEVIDEDSLTIKVKFDKEKRTITLTDTGIGMSKEELQKNLGIVARSGTTEFLKAATDGTDPLSLIGQFGVGFYSVYLVADKVTVISKRDGHKQYVWESRAQQTFTITEDPRGDTLGRGTQVILQLKEDADEFLDENQLTKLIGRYSQFIVYPISIWSSRSVSKEVPIDEPADEAAEPGDEDEVTVSEEEDEDAAPAPKTKTVTETVEEWKRINLAKAIWTRNPSDISEQEYADFYKSLSSDNTEYLTKIHFHAEGEMSFRSILFIPKTAEYGLYDKFYEKSTALKLYVRRVLISDEFDDFLPRYMNFVKGVVDSDDLPLNVNRETLAQNRVLKVMSKKITNKVLDMLRKLAESGEDEEGEDEGAEDEEESISSDETDAYTEFWNQFGKSIKLGMIDDRANKKKLSKLLRFQSSKSEGKLTSLEDYVERMAEEQSAIYYITGESLEAVESSPMLERLKKKGLEVLYMVDPLDEYVVQSLTEFDGIQLQSVTKKDLNLGDEEELEALKEEYSGLCAWLQKLYGKKVEEVVVSNRLTDSPAIIVTGTYGWTANMERIAKAQTFADPTKHSYMSSRKTMEINPANPIIQALKAQSETDGDNSNLVDLANLLYDASLATSGFAVSDTDEYSKRLFRVISHGLNIEATEASPEPTVETAEGDHDEL